MRYLINDIAASKGGALSILKSFYEYIIINNKEDEFVFLLSAAYIKETENIKVIVRDDIKKSGVKKLFFDFFSGKRYIKKFNPDVVISLQNIITFGYKGTQFVYVHQAIPFQNAKKFSFFKKEERLYAIYQYIIGSIIKLSIKKATATFVQTNWMKKNVIAKCKINSNKVNVVPIGVDYSIDGKYKLNEKSFLYPSLIENDYKNQKCIYEACDILKHKGYNDYVVKLTLESNNRLFDNIVFCGKLEKRELDKEYSYSVVLFPSYIETVGLPLIEAMSVGAIIIVADCEYAHEILGDYNNAYYFNPFKSDELASLMEDVLNRKIFAKPCSNNDHVLFTDWGKILSDNISK